MIVRRLLPKECDAFWEIRLQSLRDSPEAYGSAYEEEACLSPEERKAHCDWSDDSFVIGAFEDERLVGIVGLRRETRVKSRHKALVIGMYVLPEYRAQGLGGLLMDKLIQEARQLPGLDRLGIFVVSGNDGAKRLYDRCGFVVFGIEPDAKRQNGISYDMVFMSLGL